MTMQNADLVTMINQIADFFDAYPEQEAVSGVTEHLRKFWDPSMRSALLDARESLHDRLHPIARRALDGLAETAP
jgi:formate dehydrogenase subunit delta